MTTKTARVYTLDELKEKCQKALADPKLVEIVKTAPWNKDGEVNLSWVYKEAEKYVHGETKDLQKTKKLAVSTRFLAMLRRDYPGEFEALFPLAQLDKNHEASIDIWEPMSVTLTADRVLRVEPAASQYVAAVGVTLGFRHMDQLMGNVINLLKTVKDHLDLFNGPEFSAAAHRRKEFFNLLIQLLEEKFGLKVKVCGNCKYFLGLRDYRDETRKIDPCIVCGRDNFYLPLNLLLQGCENWTLKEVSEKKEN